MNQPATSGFFNGKMKEQQSVTPELASLNPDFSKLMGVIPVLFVGSKNRTLIGYRYIDNNRLEQWKTNGTAAFSSPYSRDGKTAEIQSAVMDCDNDTMLVVIKNINDSSMQQTTPAKFCPNYLLTDNNGVNVLAAAVFDESDGTPLMVGFMNQEALSLTVSRGTVTFWKRTEARIWEKGETSGNKLIVKDLVSSFYGDFLCLYVKPLGPVCHRNTRTCFDQ